MTPLDHEYYQILQEADDALQERNSCHNPPGSREGGRFCSKKLAQRRQQADEEREHYARLGHLIDALQDQHGADWLKVLSRLSGNDLQRLIS